MTSTSIRVQRAVTARETWVVVLVVLLCVAVPTALAMGFLIAVTRRRPKSQIIGRVME